VQGARNKWKEVWNGSRSVQALSDVRGKGACRTIRSGYAIYDSTWYHGTLKAVSRLGRCSGSPIFRCIVDRWRHNSACICILTYTISTYGSVASCSKTKQIVEVFVRITHRTYGRSMKIFW